MSKPDLRELRKAYKSHLLENRKLQDEKIKEEIKNVMKMKRKDIESKFEFKQYAPPSSPVDNEDVEDIKEVEEGNSNISLSENDLKKMMEIINKDYKHILNNNTQTKTRKKKTKEEE